MRQQRAKREWLAAARKLRSSGVTRGTYFMSPTKAMSAGDAPAARKARMACNGTGDASAQMEEAPAAARCRGFLWEMKIEETGVPVS
jgi:hypothetical protein